MWVFRQERLKKILDKYDFYNGYEFTFFKIHTRNRLLSKNQSTIVYVLNEYWTFLSRTPFRCLSIIYSSIKMIIQLFHKENKICMFW